MELLPPAPPLPVVDLLSSLPEHLLDEILTRLDLRDAVRTSALSRAWRRRWESIPSLALRFPSGTPASVIDHVLRRYTGPSISRFVFCVEDDHDVDDWLLTLSRRGVESICIYGIDVEDDYFTLGSGAIYSCDRLVSLSLECSIPPIPQPGGGGGGGFAGFPVLQKLYLKFVFFADTGERELEAIIRGSPLLRVLVLDEVYTPVDCMIEARNLHTLQFYEFDGNDCWRFGELPRLQYASIYVTEYRHDEHHFLEFLAAVSQVQELHLNLPDEVKIDTIPFTFHNLKSLELLTHFVDMDPILLMFSLLRSSPNLEKLQIEIRLWEPEWVENWDILSEEWTDAQWTDGMCANLQVVQINSCMRWLPLSFMKLILCKANLLRTLSVDVCPLSQDDPLNELLQCRRASAQAEVLFKVQLEGIDFNRVKFAE